MFFLRLYINFDSFQRIAIIPLQISKRVLSSFQFYPKTYYHLFLISFSLLETHFSAFCTLFKNNNSFCCLDQLYFSWLPSILRIHCFLPKQVCFSPYTICIFHSYFLQQLYYCNNFLLSSALFTLLIIFPLSNK